MIISVPPPEVNGAEMGRGPCLWFITWVARHFGLVTFPSAWMDKFGCNVIA